MIVGVEVETSTVVMSDIEGIDLDDNPCDGGTDDGAPVSADEEEEEGEGKEEEGAAAAGPAAGVIDDVGGCARALLACLNAARLPEEGVGRGAATEVLG